MVHIKKSPFYLSVDKKTIPGLKYFSIDKNNISRPKHNIEFTKRESQSFPFAHSCVVEYLGLVQPSRHITYITYNYFQYYHNETSDMYENLTNTVC